jgi:hypothetical protein
MFFVLYQPLKKTAVLFHLTLRAKIKKRTSNYTDETVDADGNTGEHERNANIGLLDIEY